MSCLWACCLWRPLKRSEKTLTSQAPFSRANVIAALFGSLIMSSYLVARGESFRFRLFSHPMGALICANSQRVAEFGSVMCGVRTIWLMYLMVGIPQKVF